jgi:hypothetical protein
VRDFSVSGHWFTELAGKGQHLLDVIQNALYSAHDWTKEWQPLLASLLVVFAALILAWAILKAARIRAAASQQNARDQQDLRLSEKTSGTSPPAAPADLVGNLEQLRSFIRSALASLSLTTEKENHPAYFLCQRIAHLRLERFALPANATKAARDLRATLLEQLELLRLHLKKDAPLPEISEILVQLNASARNLMTALVPASDKQRQTRSDVR